MNRVHEIPRLKPRDTIFVSGLGPKTATIISFIVLQTNPRSTFFQVIISEQQWSLAIVTTFVPSVLRMSLKSSHPSSLSFQ